MTDPATELALALREIEVVNAIVRGISGKGRVDEVVQEVIEHALRYLGVERMSVTLADPGARQLIPRWVSGVPREVVRSAGKAIDLSDTRDIAAQCVNERRPMICHDAENDPRTDKQIVRLTRTKAFALLPLLVDGAGIGFIGFEILDPARKIGEADVARFQRFADTLSLFFQNSRLYEELENWKNTLAQRVDEKTRELREAHDYLNRFMRYLSAVVQHSPTGILAVDAAGALRVTNAAAGRMLGVDPAEIYLQSLRPFFRPSDWQERVLPLLGRSESAEETLVRNWECELVARTGEPVRASLSVVRFRDPDRDESSFLFVLQDLRELRLLESKLIQSERLRLIGQMAAGVSHELNAPLGVISGFLSLVRERVDAGDAVTRRHLDCIGEAVARGRTFIENLLDVSRAAPIRLARVPVREVVERTLYLFGLRKLPGGVRIESSIPSDLPDLYADVGKIEQALFNLLANALDAVGDRGLIRVTAGSRTVSPDEVYVDGYRLDRRDDPPESEFILFRSRDMATLAKFSSLSKPGDRVAFIEVLDDGPGIPADRLKTIFEPFFTTKPTGTGLGLALILGTIKRHHGAMRVRSEPGGGALFSMLLPVHDDMVRFERMDTP